MPFIKFEFGAFNSTSCARIAPTFGKFCLQSSQSRNFHRSFSMPHTWEARREWAKECVLLAFFLFMAEVALYGVSSFGILSLLSDSVCMDCFVNTVKTH